MDENTTWEAIVIGGGAAGFFGAIKAAESGGRVLLLEATDQFLSKVKVSGGGRCNVTHSNFVPLELSSHYPRGEKELVGPFSRFQPSDTMEWFRTRGVALKTETDGRIFPETDSSQTIIDCILREAARRSVELRTRCRVREITREADRFVLHLKDEKLAARNILLATGGASGGHLLAQKLGHTITELAPSLFTFEISDPLLKDLAGISVPNGSLELKIGKGFREQGPILITHWGLSGPGVLRLSAWAARELAERSYRAELIISWTEPHSIEAGRNQLTVFRQINPQKSVAATPMFSLVRRLWERFCEIAEVPPGTLFSGLSNAQRDRLCEEIFRSRLQITGKGIFKEEFVTCGGVSRREVDFRTMESRITAGLFFAGEVLDIDGETGGFNFQNAWTTGWHAGDTISGRIGSTDRP